MNLQKLSVAGLLVLFTGPVFGHNASLAPADADNPAPAEMQAEANTASIVASPLVDSRALARADYKKSDRQFRRSIRVTRAAREAEFRRERIKIRNDKPSAFEVAMSYVGPQTCWYGAVVGSGAYRYPYFAAPCHRPAYVAPYPAYASYSW
jgi:hypothetical protein